MNYFVNVNTRSPTPPHVHPLLLSLALMFKESETSLNLSSVSEDNPKVLSSIYYVVQHKAQHTGDVSHLCSKEKTLGVEVVCVCTSEDERRGCVFTTLPIGGFIYSMTHPCPFTQK